MTVLYEVWYNLCACIHKHTHIGEELLGYFFSECCQLQFLFMFYFHCLTLWIYVIVVLKHIAAFPAIKLYS